MLVSFSSLRNDLEAVGSMDKAVYYNNMAKTTLESLQEQKKLPANKQNVLASTLAGILYEYKDEYNRNC